MRTSTIVSISVGTLVSGFVAYAFYFDYKRRHDSNFRRALKRDARKQARLAKEEAESEKKQREREIKNAVQEAIEDGFPTDLEEKEAYFMNQISQGEILAGEGSDPVAAALCFYKGLKVYPEPKSLIGIYDNTVPKDVLEILAVMVAQDANLEVGPFGQAPQGSSSDPEHFFSFGTKNGGTLKE